MGMPMGTMDAGKMAKMRLLNYQHIKTDIEIALLTWVCQWEQQWIERY
jgi:hypothetical protein